MDGARHEFLAGAALALDKHTCVRGRGARDESEELSHGVALAHDVVFAARLLLAHIAFVTHLNVHAHVLHGHGRLHSKSGEQFQIILGEAIRVPETIHVDCAEQPVADLNRCTHSGRYPVCSDRGCFAQTIILLRGLAEDGGAMLAHIVDDGGTDGDFCEVAIELAAMTGPWPQETLALIK